MEHDANDHGLLLNLTADEPSKNKASKKSPKETRKKDSVHSPSKGKIFDKNDGSSQNSRSKKHFNAQKEHDKQFHESGSEHVRTSSIFKSNPEIPSLSMCQPKGISEPLFSSKTFDSLNLHPHLVSCLKSRMEVIKLTKVQEKAIPVLLEGKDALVKSCTGSGKTLAYAVPVVQKLQEITPEIKRFDGIFSLIVVPTRELALQCFECFSTLTNAFTRIVPGYLIGGEKKKSEKARLRKGINILICTPGRLLDHLDTTACLTLEKIKFLIIDEADRLLEQGFEDSVNKIVSKCPQFRQTVLLSATLTTGVERLAGISLKNPVHIDLASKNGSTDHDFEEFSLPSSLKQSIVVVPSKLRLTVMSAFIIDNYLHSLYKGLVFMCSQSSVDFHYYLLTSVLVPLLNDKGHKCKFFKLHGNMKQEERTEIFTSFRTAKQGILLSTDVAARGLDLPHLDWILQTSAPTSTEIYVHRVGRTARIGKQGSALLFLLPSESKFSQLLSQHKIQYEVVEANKVLQSLLDIGNIVTFKKKPTAEDCAMALQTQYEKEVYTEKKLLQCAKEAFNSYIQSYVSYPKDIRWILPFKALHLGHVCKSFCLREAPSQLGIQLPTRKNFSKFPRKESNKMPQKRKHTTTVSEFDSGLSFLKGSHGSKMKRRKH